MKRKIGAKIADLDMIGESKDPEWSYLMNTLQDKRHFYETAFMKVKNDADYELAEHSAKQSPYFRKPPDKVNDTSKFPDIEKDVFERMKDRLEKTKAPTDLDVLLQNKLGNYVVDLLEKDPIKSLNRNTRSR